MEAEAAGGDLREEGEGGEEKQGGHSRGHFHLSHREQELEWEERERGGGKRKRVKKGEAPAAADTTR